MPLSALIFGVTGESDAFNDAAWLLPIAGQPLVEYQLRLAHAAGAAHILLLTDHLPAELQSSLAQLAISGIRIEIVRTPGEAADHIHPDEDVLIVAAGVVAEPALLFELGRVGEQRLITLAETPESAAFERIDAVTHWSGFACVSGDVLRKTAAELGEWDFCATLLRRAVQAGIPRDQLDCAAPHAPLIARVLDAGDARAFDRLLIARERPAHSGMLEQFIWNPIARLSLPLLLRKRAEPGWFLAIMGLFSVVALGSAVFGTWREPPVVALVLFLLAGFAGTVARRLLALSLQDASRLNWLHRARILIGGIALVLITRQMLDYGYSWGCMVLSLWTLVEMARLGQIDPWFAGRLDLPFWRATPDGVALIMLVSLQAKNPLIGLDAMTAYTAITSLILIRIRSS